ncbi:uncharacterized protein FIBRA_05247 [Fibroporia radiculosa]|uniref:2-dehydropantoate 2-reductase n=1 Tax=Fibroporia radiculosa TaxID=599839 RepID=J4IAL6_9APHY|nr:uncharacterized protein FIBRA_05247 [Fibroporia radiculosa]CCM03126.1 predicted protein [Fibroporia radiculosa]
MHVHILGFGAIGTLVAHHLRAALDPKHVISIIHRSPAVSLSVAEAGAYARLEQDGVILTQRNFLHESSDPFDDIVYRRLEVEHRRLKVRALPEGERKERLSRVVKPQEPTRIHSLIVATKAPVAVKGIRMLLPRLSPDSTIVLLHNGMGVYEELMRTTFRNSEQRPNIVVSVNTHGAWLKNPAHVVHTGVGAIQLGIMPDGRGRDFEASLDTSLPKEDQKLNLDDITPLLDDTQAPRYISLRNTMSALMSMSALNVSWNPIYDIQLAMRRKLVVNSVINPITALLSCRNGQLFESVPARRLCYQLCREASRVFYAQWRAELRDLEPPNSRMFSKLENRFPRELSAGGLVEECQRVAQLTRNNFSSMLVDVRKNQNTEVAYMNGYIVHLAKKYDVRVPTMQALLDLVYLRTSIPLDLPVDVQSVL